MPTPANTQPEASAAPTPRRLLTPRWLLVLVSVGGVLGFALSPRVQIKLGLFTYDHWFLDTFAILAANDAVQLGRDPFKPNNLDFLNRPHCYSHWWFALGPLGLTRADNFGFGASWVLAFLGTFFLTVRPRTHPEAAWLALLLLSPPVMLAVMRGNNDLVVFAALGLGGLALAREGSWSLAAALAGIVLATGLKFYPGVAAAGLLLVRPGRRLQWTLVVAGLVLAFVALDVWRDLARATIPVSINVFSFGGPLLLQDFGIAGPAAKLLTAVLVLAGGAWLALRRQTTGLADEANGGLPERFLFVVAAAMLVACFMAGISYAYRWIFGLWLAPWLWRQVRAGRDPLAKYVPGGTGTLLTLCFWSDGLFCLVVNLLPGPIPTATLDRWQVFWRYASQPLNWVLVILLAGWLLDALRAAWAESRKQPLISAHQR